MASMNLQSKLPNLQTSIFTVMSKLANETGAINLAQGYPNFPTDPILIEGICKAMKDGYNQYMPMAGASLLRETIAEKYSLAYGHSVDPGSEITVTAGATQAIFTAIAALINPGDEVILFDPAYDCYIPAIHAFGGRAISIPLQAPDFRVDWDIVASKITRMTKMIIVNNPHNPAGTVFRDSDMQHLERLVTQNGLYVVSDEVYEHLVYDGRPHLSILKYPGIYQRGLAMFSFGKSLHATGWKMGYCIAPPYLMKEFQKIHEYNVFSVNSAMQIGIANYLKDAGTYKGLSPFFQQKRDLFLELMKGSAFKMLPTEGSYFMLADYSALSDLGDREFANKWTRDKGVATIPISPFYQNPPDQKIVRFCFAKTDEMLEAAAEKLKI